MDCKNNLFLPNSPSGGPAPWREMRLSLILYMDLKNFSGYLMILIFIVMATSGCYQSDHPVEFSSDEITRLISGDTIKSWETVKILSNGSEPDGNDCSVKPIRKFSFSKQDQTTHLYEIYANPAACDGTDTLLETGEWYIIEGTAVTGSEDTLALIINSDTVKYGISEITSTLLKLKGRIKNALTEEDLIWYNP